MKISFPSLMELVNNLFCSIASGSRDCQIILWNLTNGSRNRTLSGHTALVNAIKLNAEILVSGDDEGNVKIWNPVTLTTSPVAV